MRFSSFVAASAIASASTVAAHASHGQHAHLHHKTRQQSDVLITTGAKGLGDGQVHTRFEISDLAANRPEQWALFVQAMDKFTGAAATNLTGFYSIASIHGVPRQDWNNVPQCESCQGADGYCPHDSVLFPAWHRAYVALFEQEFINFAFEAANAYPDSKRQAMLDAAATIRFPYWDWAAKPDPSGNVLPSIISSPQISYEGPNGQETITNPVYQFALPEPSAMYYGPFNSWPDTMRWPNTNAVSAVSQDSTCMNAFNSIRENIADQIYNLMTVCKDYLHFSNDQGGSGETSCTNSIEGIHNTIHTTSGGPGSKGVSGGHMTYLPVAAFDPIFFLHHCNVDRMFALWQTINPDSYGADQVAAHNTWTVASGSTQGPDSPLEPFRKDASSFWTTNDVRDWEATFSYTYPEFSTSDGSRSAIIAYVNALYGPSASLTASSISEEAEKSQSNAATSSTSSTIASSTSMSSSSSAISSVSSYSSTTSAASSTITSAATSVANAIASSSTSSVAGSGLLGGLGSVVSGLDGTVSSVLSGVESGVAGSLGGVPSVVTGGIGSVETAVAGGLGGVQSAVAGGLSGVGQVASSVEGMVGTIGSQVMASKTGNLGSITTGLAGVINSTLGGLTGGLTGSSQHQYGCTIDTPRYALNGSYYVYVFEGQPSTSDCSQWMLDTNLVGAVGVLGGGEMTGNMTVTGSVPLTRWLQGKVVAGILADLTPNITGPYLAQNLQWKIVSGGEEVHPSVVPGFQASVYSAKAAPASNDILPVWSPLQPVVEATKGKAGGRQSTANWNYGPVSGSSGSGSGSSSGACPYKGSGSSGPYQGSSGNSTAPTYTASASGRVPSSGPMSVPSSGPVSGPSWSTTAPIAPAYTGAASKASFGVFGVFAVAGLVAML